MDTVFIISSFPFFINGFLEKLITKIETFKIGRKIIYSLIGKTLNINNSQLTKEQIVIVCVSWK